MKKHRELIFAKYGGKCAYCGCELQKGWHIDHIEPAYHNWSDEDIKKHLKKPRGSNEIENLNPACPRCNRWKGTWSIEQFRHEICIQTERLKRDSASYRLLLDFKRIDEECKPVEFYFETIREMKKEDIYIDLSKCTEEQIKHIFSLLPDEEVEGDYAVFGPFKILYMIDALGIKRWIVGTNADGKQELTYPEFIKLFDGVDENNGWIKLESEADLPKEAGDYWVFWDNKVIVQYWFTTDYYDLKKQTQDWMQVVTHYQPITKPLPPKF